MGTAMRPEIRDVAPGLWLWRAEHPGWRPGLDWDEVVATTVVESGRRESSSSTRWRPGALRRARDRPAALLARRHPASAARADRAGKRAVPGGLVALYDGRGRSETPLWIPEKKTIVFADALVAQGGELRVWWSPSYEKRARPALRELLELPFERVIVSHGEPVHSRAEFEQALAREPYR